MGSKPRDDSNATPGERSRKDEKDGPDFDEPADEPADFKRSNRDTHIRGRDFGEKRDEPPDF